MLVTSSSVSVDWVVINSVSLISRGTVLSKMLVLVITGETSVSPVITSLPSEVICFGLAMFKSVGVGHLMLFFKFPSLIY